MAKITTQEFSHFYKNKTILKSFLFDVDFPDGIYQDKAPGNPDLYRKFKDYTSEFSFRLDPLCIKNVSIPDLSFQKENRKIGPTVKSTPVLNFDGYEIKLDLEEDAYGNVRKFIEHCKSRNIHSSGLYWPANFAEIPEIVVSVNDGTNPGRTTNCLMKIKFKNIIFLSASEITFDYSTSTAINYSLTFSANTLETVYTLPLKGHTRGILGLESIKKIY